jgi:hypothetical protein
MGCGSSVRCPVSIVPRDQCVRKLAQELKLRSAVLFYTELVQPSVEGAAAAHELNEALRIVLYAEGKEP